MKLILKLIYRIFKYIGLDLKIFFLFIANFPNFILDLIKFEKQSKIQSIFPIISEKKFTQFDKHLFQLDLIVAQEIYNENPKNHLDIGSRVDGLVAHVASFRKIDVLDIRELRISYKKNISVITKDLLEINSSEIRYDSISSVGCIAHIGLGRYGDKIDVEGDKKALKIISKILNENGMLYLAVPTGKEKVVFNSHRQYNYQNFKKMLNEENLHVLRTILIDDKAEISEKYFYENNEIAYTLFVCKKLNNNNILN